MKIDTIPRRPTKKNEEPEFSVVVSNAVGSVSSPVATLAVHPKTIIEEEPAVEEEVWNTVGFAAKGVKLVVPKELTDLIKGVKLAPKTSAVYVWTYTDANGVTTELTNAKGKPVTGKNYTAKVSGTYSVRVEYTPYDTATKTPLPKVVSETHTFYGDTNGGKIQFTAPLKIAKANGFIAEALPENTVVAPNTVVRGESLKYTVTLDTPPITGAVYGPYNYRWYEGSVKPANLRREELNTFAKTDSFVVAFTGAKPSAYIVVVETVARDPKKPAKALATVKSKALKPKLILPPYDVKVSTKLVDGKVVGKDGGNVSLSVKAKGTSKLKYQWYKGSVAAGNELVGSAKGAVASVVSGANKATLNIKKAGASDGGVYWCVVTSDKVPSLKYAVPVFVEVEIVPML